MNTILKSLSILALSFSLTTIAEAEAATAVLSWTPPTNTTGIDGYQIQYGTETGKYTGTLDVPGVASKTGTVLNLNNGTKYFFVVRSRNANSTLFSVNSNEVSATTLLASPTGLTVTISITNQ
jgi:hypothetical protein